MRKRQTVSAIREGNIIFAAPHASGHLKQIQSNLLKIKMARVQILTTPGCGGCATVKEMLDKMKVKYSVIDVQRNQRFLKNIPLWLRQE